MLKIAAKGDDKVLLWSGSDGWMAVVVGIWFPFQKQATKFMRFYFQIRIFIKKINKTSQNRWHGRTLAGCCRDVGYSQSHAFYLCF